MLTTLAKTSRTKLNRSSKNGIIIFPSLKKKAFSLSLNSFSSSVDQLIYFFLLWALNTLDHIDYFWNIEPALLSIMPLENHSFFNGWLWCCDYITSCNYGNIFDDFCNISWRILVCSFPFFYSFCLVLAQGNETS